MAEVSVRKVVKVYDGGVQAVKGIDLEIADREFVVLVGPVRLRQIHHAADDRGAGGDFRRRNLDRRRRRQRRAAARSRHRHGVPELRALSAHERVRQHGVRPEAAEVPEGRDQAPGRRGGTHPGHRARCWTASRAPCPVASASASRWAAPSCATRRSSCSTSRCPTWTPSCACRCAPRSRRCTRRCAPRRSTSPTTRSRR